MSKVYSEVLDVYIRKALNKRLINQINIDVSAAIDAHHHRQLNVFEQEMLRAHDAKYEAILEAVRSVFCDQPISDRLPDGFKIIAMDSIQSMAIDASDYIGLPTWKEEPPKLCDCGAKHTSFPNHHLNWCSTKK